MATDAVRALDDDPGTEVIVLVSKPPDPAVARQVISASKHTAVVAACLGMPAVDCLPADVPVAATLEEGAVLAARALGAPVPDLADGMAGDIEKAIATTGESRTAVRGFFTGGTLCYEAQVVLSRCLGPVYSNIPLSPDLALPAPSGAHICLDLGEEEYTRGRPHPMIDPSARREVVRDQAGGRDVAVVLLDVVLGHGSHANPAGEIAATCADLVARGTAVVAYVLGTHADPQDFDAQRRTLREAGALVAQTSAHAARVAAAISAGRPDLAAASPA